MGHRVEISTNYVSVVLDFPGADTDKAYWLWKRALDALGRLRSDERMHERELAAPARVEANAMGFVIEQASEHLNGYLPGGHTS